MLPVAQTAKEFTVKTARRSDERAAITTLVTAFSCDPAARWAYSDSEGYLAHFPDFIKAFGGRAFAHGTAHVVDGCAGAALWLPPGVEPDEAVLMSVLERTVPGTIRSEVFDVIEQMGRFHPQEPHWYLPMIGVDTRYQGRGLGSVLLRHALAECDRDGVPAYLESSNPRNVPLYQRHGFEIIGTIQAGSSPELYPMLRKASPR